jgi:SAM-dependent methyltransferase
MCSTEIWPGLMTCPICTTAAAVKFFCKEGRDLLICRDCRHVFWETAPTREDLADYYSRRYTSIHSQATIQESARDYYRSHLKELLRISGVAKQNAAILDYGCSIPVLLAEARLMGFRSAIGVDYSQESKAYGGEHGVQVISPEQLRDFPDCSLEIARFSHTLEHSIDPVAVLGEVVSKVRPGGLVYITQPNFPVFRYAESPLDLRDTVYPEHLHFFSPISLAAMARRHHLEIQTLFSHQNESAAAEAYNVIFDLEYARERMAPYANRGDAFFPELSNYPHYMGENSVLYAFRPKR